MNQQTTMTTERDFTSRPIVPRCTLDEQQALVDYRAALRMKLEAAHALRAGKNFREREMAYEAMALAQNEVRRKLAVLNAALTTGVV